MIYLFLNSSESDGTNSCVEATIFEDQRSLEDRHSVTMAACIRSPYPTVFYRTVLTTFTTDGVLLYLSSSLILLLLLHTQAAANIVCTVPDDFPSSSPESRISPPTATPSGSDTDDTAVDDDTENQGSGSGKNVGAIAGGTVGGVADLVLIILAAWYVLRRRRAKRAEIMEIGTPYVLQGQSK